MECCLVYGMIVCDDLVVVIVVVCRYTNLRLQFDSSGIVIFISRCHFGCILHVLRIVSQTHDTWESLVMNV
jgi:hypothetical protein